MMSELQEVRRNLADIVQHLHPQGSASPSESFTATSMGALPSSLTRNQVRGSMMLLAPPKTM